MKNGNGEPFACAAAAVRVLLALMACAPAAAHADTFELASGGRVSGQRSSTKESERAGAVRVGVSSQIVLTLTADQVRKATRENEALSEYRRIAPSFPRTVEAQWTLAEWCRERRLTEQRGWHLRQVVALDSQHGPAWRGLGYTQVSGRWIVRAARQRDEGYQFYRGHWRLPQEIELLEARDKQDLAEKEWRGQIKRWRKMVDSDNFAGGLANLRAIRDANAVPALAERLASDPSRHARLAYIEALAAIATPSAFAALAECSLADADEELFHAAVDAVRSFGSPTAAPFYIRSLNDADNQRLNRAAFVLGQLNDEGAVGPLIDALVTTHAFIVPGRGGGAGMTAASFARGAEGGPAAAMLESGVDPQVGRRQLYNAAVLASLVKLTGRNLGYDQQAWRSWQNSAGLASPTASDAADSDAR